MKPIQDLLEKENKYKHSAHCQKQWVIFSLLVISVDSMTGRESQVILANLCRSMAAKTEIVFLYDLRIFFPKSIEGQGTGLGARFGLRIGAINCVTK